MGWVGSDSNFRVLGWFSKKYKEVTSVRVACVADWFSDYTDGNADGSECVVSLPKRGPTNYRPAPSIP